MLYWDWYTTAVLPNIFSKINSSQLDVVYVYVRCDLFTDPLFRFHFMAMIYWLTARKLCNLCIILWWKRIREIQAQFNTFNHDFNSIHKYEWWSGSLVEDQLKLIIKLHLRRWFVVSYESMPISHSCSPLGIHCEEHNANVSVPH